ncbi:hypothetical protein SALBM135S_07178 [Streptomyces alboniger]
MEPGHRRHRGDRIQIYRDAKKVKEVPGRKHMVDIVGLKPSTTYAFTVRARDAEGNVSPDSRKN